VTPVPIEHTHAFRVADLPPLQNDLFDRLLIVQSREIHAPIVTADPAFQGYAVDIVGA
jgi:PIN domain nuclease of toxin-antitoxin system